MAASITKGGGGGGVFRRRMLKNQAYMAAVKPGGPAAILPYQFQLQGLVDNTAFTFATILIPNAIVGAAIRLWVVTMLGDGDSTEISQWNLSFSRLVGAASKCVISAKSVIALTVGAAANSAGTVTNVAVAGANTALQSFALQFKNARTAGAADNHFAIIDMQLYNLNAGGAYVS